MAMQTPQPYKSGYGSGYGSSGYGSSGYGSSGYGGSGYGSSGYGTEYASGPASKNYPGVAYAVPKAPQDPFSGSYRGAFPVGKSKITLDMEVDLDQLREFSPVLNVVSGTVCDESHTSRLWSGDSQAAYFRSENGAKVQGSGSKRDVTCGVAVKFSGGGGISGKLAATFEKSQVGWKGSVKLTFDGRTCTFEVERINKFFRDVRLDIDYTDEVFLPSVVLAKRKLDLFTVFKDAGVNLIYEAKDSDKVEDPTSDSPWTKSDLYEVMNHHFDEVEDVDSNIWCMMGKVPPNSREMGFAFDRNGRHGFAIFTGHRSFKGYKAESPKENAGPRLRFLHYMVNECGHCLGLASPFEKGNSDSLSWMNSAWKYDESHPGKKFYDEFSYQFDEKELLILRHAAGKDFKKAAELKVSRSITESVYGAALYPADHKTADSSDSEAESDGESAGYGGYGKRAKTSEPKPNRKLKLSLKFPNQSYKKGQLVDYEVKVQNIGKLPALIDSDVSAEGGNLQLYVSDPSGAVQLVDPYARPIKSSYTKPKVLYTAEDSEGADRYSDIGYIGDGKEGNVFNKPGKYTVKAKYSAGRYNVTSESYTVTIDEPDTDDEDEETTAQISEMAGLGGSSYSRFKKAQDYFEKLAKKPVEKKKSHVAAMIALFEGIAKPATRAVDYGGGSKVKTERKLVETKPARAPADLLKDSDDLIEHYHAKGEKSDNLTYAKLAKVRAKLYLATKQVDTADREMNQLYGDLIARGVKQEVLTGLTKEYQKMKNPKTVEEKSTPGYYQSKVAKVLDWQPPKPNAGEKEVTGIGLGYTFNDFDKKHKKKVKVLYDILSNTYDNTQEVKAVLSYANGLQKGREANDMAVKYSVQAFIVHNNEAKKVGIRFPDPPSTDPAPAPTDAPTRLVRKGRPQESWMNYWRMDGDFNFHHRHWHAVYNYPFGPHSSRQGELFGYMHAQMLTRYDAERESWGLLPVKPFRLYETARPFDAGAEFHGETPGVAARISGNMEESQKKQIVEWTNKYLKAIKDDEDGAYNRDCNWAGAALEPNSLVRGMGWLHNFGHMVFSKFITDSDSEKKKSSYMGSTLTAVRDPVFFRWHKYIDDLWQQNNDRFRIDLNKMAANVTLESSDIAITASPTHKWDNSGKDQIETIKTELVEPYRKFEQDDKLTHEEFYYHIRFRQKVPAKITIRIYICPERHANDRRKWIEMDKFVHELKADGSTAYVTRRDKESSVIKRLPEMYEGAQEAKFVPEIEGFCDCGWPYTMLLPRGTRVGERYKLCVIATDNTKDSIGVRTHCGSMSYCGAKDMEYPDLLPMGYPFSSKLKGESDNKSLLDILEAHPSAGLKSFVIKNAPSRFKSIDPTLVDVEPSPMEVVSLWPKMGSEEKMITDDEYRPSIWTGTFRLILYTDEIQGDNSNPTIKVYFKGRGKGKGPYAVENAEIAARHGTTFKTDSSRRKPILVKGLANFTVPEEGLVSDAINFRMEDKDYFVTFTLQSPGCYTITNTGRRVNTIVMKNTMNYKGEWRPDERYKNMRTRNGLYCIEKVVA